MYSVPARGTTLGCSSNIMDCMQFCSTYTILQKYNNTNTQIHNYASAAQLWGAAPILWIASYRLCSFVVLIQLYKYIIIQIHKYKLIKIHKSSAAQLGVQLRYYGLHHIGRLQPGRLCNTPSSTSSCTITTGAKKTPVPQNVAEVQYYEVQYREFDRTM